MISASSSCQRPQHIDYVIYGIYCGECFGHCATMFKVGDGSVWIDTTDSYFKNDRHLRFGTYKANPDFYLIAKTAIDSLPAMLLDTSNHTYLYGMPDARDQCGIYVEYGMGKYTRSFFIDTEPEHGIDIPTELQRYRERIRNLVNEFYKK